LRVQNVAGRQALSVLVVLEHSASAIQATLDLLGDHRNSPNYRAAGSADLTLRWHDDRSTAIRCDQIRATKKKGPPVFTGGP